MVKLIVIISAIAIIGIGTATLVLMQQNNNQPITEPQNNTAPTSTPTTTPEGEGAYVEYSEEAVANTSGTKILFFHAPWCPQCRALEASIESEKIPQGVTIFKVDYDSNQELRQRYGVTIQTTLVKIDNEGNKVDAYVAYEEPTLKSVEEELL